METIRTPPISPLNLYVKLYCEKRKSSKEKIITGHTLLKEATKSWLSLNGSEKEMFIEKYKSTLCAYKKEIANSLKNVKPYLKKKDHKRSKKDRLNKNSVIINQDQNEFTSHNNSCGNVPEETNIMISNVSYYPDGNTMLERSSAEIQQFPIDPNDLNTNKLLQRKFPEPIPPKLKSGKELFEMLSINIENSSTWESLSTYEKRRYQNAALSIKRNYIKSYRSFLESLSPMELFNHYINNKYM